MFNWQLRSHKSTSLLNNSLGNIFSAQRILRLKKVQLRLLNKISNWRYLYTLLRGIISDDGIFLLFIFISFFFYFTSSISFQYYGNKYTKIKEKKQAFRLFSSSWSSYFSFCVRVFIFISAHFDSMKTIW